MKPLTPQKSAFFKRKGRKRVKEWREVTFMKELAKPLYYNFEQERTFRPSGLVPILDESWNIETKTFNRGKEIKAVSSLS